MTSLAAPTPGPTRSDVGGRHEHFGPIGRPAVEPTFQERWQARTFGLMMFLSGTVDRNGDAFRETLEQLPADEYFAGYYQSWLATIERRLEEGGWIAEGEVDACLAGDLGPSGVRRSRPSLAERMLARSLPLAMRPLPPWAIHLMLRTFQYSRPAPRRARFRAGDEVRVVARRPPGFTRLPGYTCGCRGRIAYVHGAMVFPDTNARGLGEDPQHLYTIAFDARELWGDEAERHASVCVDLFESYLEVDSP
jgi:nitrile hydratase subunit beta